MNIKSIISLIALSTFACGGSIQNEDRSTSQTVDTTHHNFNVCCCTNGQVTTIGATQEYDCEGPCKSSDSANVDWKLVDSLDTWQEYNDKFDENKAKCNADMGL